MDNSLDRKHPELAKQWSEKNGRLTPAEVTYGSKRVVWWKGQCGHEWQASVKSRSSGESCPICSGARVVEGINDLSTLRPDLAKEWSPKNESLLPTMVSLGSHKKAKWNGSCGHEWTAQVKSRVQGTGCPFCSHSEVLPGFNDLATLFPAVAAEWSSRNLPLLPSMVTAFSNRKVWWMCNKGHQWNSLISTRSYGSQCPYCSGDTLLKGFNDFATKYPELAEEWSERNLPLTPDAVNEKSRENVWWTCKQCGHEWKSLVFSRVKGTACPVCTDREVKSGYNDLATTDPPLAKEWDTEKNRDVKPTDISRNSLRGVWWRCSFGHSWKDTVRARAIEGKGCRCCEQEFIDNIPKLLALLYAGRKGLQVKLDTTDEIGIPLDVFVPELNLAIDTSCTPNGKGEAREQLKEFMCRKRGIRYIHIPLGRHIGENIYAREMKKAFQKAHVFISSDDDEDVRIIRRKYEALRRDSSPEDQHG